jgi:hypothetical protein
LIIISLAFFPTIIHLRLSSIGHSLGFSLRHTLGGNFGGLTARMDGPARVIETVQAVLAESGTPGVRDELVAVRFPVAQLGSLSRSSSSPVNI